MVRNRTVMYTMYSKPLCPWDSPVRDGLGSNPKQLTQQSGAVPVGHIILEPVSQHIFSNDLYSALKMWWLTG